MGTRNTHVGVATGVDKLLVYLIATVFFFYLLVTFQTIQYLPSVPTLGDISPYEVEFAPQKSYETPFPQSISVEHYESIQHPAVTQNPTLKIENLSVPPFWDPPAFASFGGVRSYLGNYGSEPMTLEQARNIGSFYNHETQGPLETIFVAIASYRDFQCPQTVESILTRATYPERVRIAVVDQIDAEVDTPCSTPALPCEQDPNQALCKFSKQIDFYQMEAKDAVGPVFARHLGHRMYRGEYFAMQSDAHVDYVNDWDTEIIKEYKASKNEMAVLTTYLSDVTGSVDEEGNRLRQTRPIMCKSDYEGHGKLQHLRHGQQPEGESGIHGEPTFEPFWAAGFSFSRGHFVVNVPYDQYLPMVFMGEEISIGLRGFTYGYDYYTPQFSKCFHYYAARDGTGKRSSVKLFWENQKRFKGVERRSMTRLNGILQMTPEAKESEWLNIESKKYGLGKVRSPKTFFDVFGIDIVNKKVEGHLCQFVGKNMHAVWKVHLRTNTMGVNYDEIDYRFRDPATYGKRNWEDRKEWRESKYIK